MTEHGLHLFVASLVAQTGRIQVPALQRQAIDLIGTDACALIAGRQQTNITEGQHRHVGLQLTHFQLGLGVTHLQRAFQAAVLIRRAPVTVHRQQTGIDPVRTAVEFEAEQADDIHTKTDRALGITGLDVEDEALRPLLRLRLLIGPDDVGEVPTEVVIARLQGGRGVFDEAALGGQRTCAETRGDSHGQH